MTDTEKAALCARIDELCAENEKLRRYGAQLFDKTLELGTENARLRELVADMWFWSYCGHIDSESQEKQMAHIDSVLNHMRELGVVK